MYTVVVTCKLKLFRNTLVCCTFGGLKGVDVSVMNADANDNAKYKLIV